MKLRTLGVVATCWLLLGCYKEAIVYDSLPNDNLELPLLLEFEGKPCL